MIPQLLKRMFCASYLPSYSSSLLFPVINALLFDLFTSTTTMHLQVATTKAPDIALRGKDTTDGGDN